MASRFWVGGAGTWDGSTTTHWAASSGGAGGQSVPGSSDTVTFDASSGGGTVTVNTTVTVQSITNGAHTGTLDFSANNNNVTLSAAVALNASGSGTRTFNLGNGTWTFTSAAAGTIIDFTTTTNLTFNANSSTLALTGNSLATASRTMVLATLTFSTITVSAASGVLSINGACTIGTLTIGAGNYIVHGADQTITTLNVNGSSAAPVYYAGATATQRTLTVTTPTIAWAAIRSLAISGASATNSFDLGGNSFTAITPPSGGGGLLVNPGMSGGMVA